MNTDLPRRPTSAANFAARLSSGELAVIVEVVKLIFDLIRQKWFGYPK